MGFEPATNNSDIWSPRALTQTPAGRWPCNLQPVRPAVLQEVLQDYHDHDTGYICLGCLCKTICHSGWQCLGCLWAVQVFEFNLNCDQHRIRGHPFHRNSVCGSIQSNAKLRNIQHGRLLTGLAACSANMARMGL